MATENNLKWFKHDPNRWLFGKTKQLSLGAKGVFKNILAHYWSAKCKLKISFITETYPNWADWIDEIIKAGCMKKDGQYFVIDFLDEQFMKITKEHPRKSNYRVENGKKGAEVRFKGKEVANG